MIDFKQKEEEVTERPPLENDIRAKFLSKKELERVVVDNPRTGLYLGLYRMMKKEGVLYYLHENVNPVDTC